MKFIHTADIHLGMVPDKDKSWSALRADEITNAFARLLEVCEERQVDLLLIAGDLFHGTPGLKDLQNLDYMLGQLSVTKTIIIAGNHDHMEAGSPAAEYTFASSAMIMPAGKFSNIYLRDINTCVTGYSYDRQEILDPIYDEIGPQREGAINILLAHGGDATHAPINFKRLARAGFDYCALGHIHKPKHIVKNKMAYPGSLEPLDRTETGRHGFIYGQVVDGETKIRLEPFNTRSYVNLGFEVKPEYTEAQIVGTIERQMEKMGAENIYRIILSGNMAPGLKPNFSPVARKYMVYEVLNNTMLEYDMDKLLIDNENNLMGRFIKTFENTNDAIAAKALKYGVEAMIATGDK